MFHRFVLASLCWTALYGTVLAQASNDAEIKPPSYLLPYALVILGIGLGLLFLCRSSRRQENVKKVDSTLAPKRAEMKYGPGSVPVISLGMMLDQVTEALGKPKIARKGSEIFAELHQAGKLGEDEAAKLHAIFEHTAGRYELVFLRKQVVQIKSQPEAKDTLVG